MSNLVREFRIAIPQDQLDDLKQRLANTRWPEEETVPDWRQGAPLSAVKSLCDYWLHHYDWRRCESRLNGFPQYQTEIDGLDIHFLHIRSPHADALPLIITHGWPGSVVEFLDVIEPLTNPTAHGGSAEDAFHLVIPSLPGYGFSAKPRRNGWNLDRIARAWIELMARLGYDHFVAQGGDWGSGVCTAIGNLMPSSCRAIHLNMALVQPGAEDLDTELTPAEQKSLADMKTYYRHESGYAKQQSTRPQTIGYGLVDSPVALAAWIYEKFHGWTDNRGAPEDALSRDQMLDNIMLHWLPATGASAARLYWESMHDMMGKPMEMPVGVSIFPRELFRPSRRWVEKVYPNLIYWNETEKGGHFAAFEQPALFVKEVRACFRNVRDKKSNHLNRP